MEFPKNKNKEKIIKASRGKWRDIVIAEEDAECRKWDSTEKTGVKTSRMKRSPRNTKSRCEQKGRGLQEAGLGRRRREVHGLSAGGCGIG